MPHIDIPFSYLSALEVGQVADCFAQLVERARRTTADGRPYYACSFRDQARKASCVVWQEGPWYAACERDWQEGRIYKMRCTYAMHERYGPQIELHAIRPATEADVAAGLDLAKIIECSRFDVEEMYRELLQLARTEIRDDGMRGLVHAVFSANEVALKQLPASDKFYTYRGGWLEHVLSLTRTAIMLVDHYHAHYPEEKPPLNRDLVVAGAMLHDVGRVREWTVELGHGIATVPGKLFGHLLLGRDIVRDTARELGNVNAELVELLEHVVLTHLTLPEWGSPRLPLIPEVLILHHADDLDAKMEMYLKCIRRDRNPGPFTIRDPVLGKPLLKGRTL